MKTKFFTVALMLCSLITFSQDNLFLINNWGTSGITQLSNVDPNNATIGGSVTTYATEDASTSSASMAMSVNGRYIYYINQTTNDGTFNVSSILAYPAAGVTTAPTAGTTVLTADLNGVANTNQLLFRRLGIAQNGWAYMVVTESGTGEVYLARFQTNGTDGSASNFTNLGTITLDGAAASPNFNNGDLVFDGQGNMYILVNQDASGGAAIIYYLSAATLAAATNSSSVTNITTKYTVKNSAGDNFQGLVTGLALSSTGTFYVAVQGGADGGIYYINSGVEEGIVTIKGPGNAINGERVADLTSNYFPLNTVLPVTFGSVNAKIKGNQLLVNWSTLAETNNDRFEIEVSGDGKNFTSIGTVDTKALNGNSDKVIEYSFSKTVDMPVAVMGISLFSLAAILLFINRKNKLIGSMFMVIGIGLVFASCSKNNDQLNLQGNNKLFVRIVQVDKDGRTSTSKVITAYKAD